MSDYFNPNALAQANGHAHGMIQGQQQGRQQGLREGHEAGFTEGQQEGYNLGYLEGHTIGWNKATEAATVEMRKQQEYTRQHVADKAALAKRVEEQQQLIATLTAKLDEMERENASLKGTNVELRQVVDALRDANERLRTEVSQLDDKLKARTKEYSDHIWQYNRCAVFMNSVRSVLEDLTTESTQQAEHVRMLFSKHYAVHIEAALKQGALKTPLDNDQILAKTMPRVAKFMADMLSKVKEHGPHNPAYPEQAEHSPSI